MPNRGCNLYLSIWELLNLRQDKTYYDCRQSLSTWARRHILYKDFPKLIRYTYVCMYLLIYIINQKICIESIDFIGFYQSKNI